ncbi:uncharacterized protein DUF4124 [Fluviicoccus keumensis]|uniref:Uncharacterized protein DUF4124 n=1 Tax=Fluviicoccus keumensis TaxID=1435465 RepID=A0A4Q7ZCB4_9GAMM|nr:DUF4124 domain-containing protein [Fluviicoccus keumensis]RZU48280.1 uncharacterized protein DUF4124 [Fluviicoccus keumensis]
MNKQLITITLFGMLSLSAFAGENFYKWVDDKGITHYSQSPPEANGKPSTVQTVNVRTRIPVDSEQAIADLEKKRQDQAKNRDDSDKKASDSKTTLSAKEKEKALNKPNCPIWKQDMETLQKANVSMDDGKGGVKTMTEEDKKKRMEETQKHIKEYCM